MVVNQGFSQGQLLLELKSGSSKDQFKDSILNALNTSSTQSSSSSTTRSVPPSETPDVSATLSSPHGADSPSPSGTDLNQSMERTPSALPALPQPSSAVQDLLQDRRIRLEADKKEKEAAEKADRKAKAEAQRESQIADDPAKANQVSYAQQRRKRLYEEKLERERIMRAIQDDKNARKERENRRKALMMEEVEGNDGANGLVSGQLLKEFGNANESSRKECALQVRLFDGSTIRRKFPPNESLRNHVRAWIEEEGSDGDMPFTLKQILTPLPNRTISISQEEESLHSLGLMPSATLVKVPVQGYTTAYVADQGVISRGISAGYNIASAGVSKITGLMGTVLGLAQAIPQEENSTPQVRREANRAAPGVNIGSLRDQGEDRYEHQLYNGNQVSLIRLESDMGQHVCEYKLT